MLLDIFQYYGQHKVVSEFEVHTSSNMLWGIQISKFDLKYMKLCERGIYLWIMYSDILLELFDFFMGS